MLYKNGSFILILVVSNIDIYIHDLFLCLRLRPVIFLTNLLILGPFSWSGYAIIKWVWEYEFVDLPRWWRYHRGKSFHKIGPWGSRCWNRCLIWHSRYFWLAIVVQTMFTSIEYCRALFFRGGLIFAYFAENGNSAKIKKAITDRSALSACMHTVIHTQNLPNLLFLSAEIHELPVLHPFIVCALWIALPTSTHNYKAFG